MRQATTQSMMATAAVGGGTKPQDSLDADKRFLDTEPLSGNTSLSEIKDWYKRLVIEITSARPGAQGVLNWALTQLT